MVLPSRNFPGRSIDFGLHENRNGFGVRMTSNGTACRNCRTEARKQNALAGKRTFLFFSNPNAPCLKTKRATHTRIEW